MWVESGLSFFWLFEDVRRNFIERSTCDWNFKNLNANFSEGQGFEWLVQFDVEAENERNP